MKWWLLNAVFTGYDCYWYLCGDAKGGWIYVLMLPWNLEFLFFRLVSVGESDGAESLRQTNLTKQTKQQQNTPPQTKQKTPNQQATKP